MPSRTLCFRVVVLFLAFFLFLPLACALVEPNQGQTIDEFVEPIRRQSISEFEFHHGDLDIEMLYQPESRPASAGGSIPSEGGPLGSFGTS
jgi:hypothetical protein